MYKCNTQSRNGLFPYNEFIRPEEVKHIVREIESYTTNQSEAMTEALRFVSENILYKKDIDKHNRPEFWQFPSETLYYGTGDCEDTSFLLASILVGLGIDEVRVVLGRWHGEGHAWVEGSIGDSNYLLESTSGKIHYQVSSRLYGYSGDEYIYTVGCEYPTIRRQTDFSKILTSIIGIMMIIVVVAAIAALISGLSKD